MEEKEIVNTPVESKLSYEQLEERLRLAVDEIMRLRKIVNDLSDNRGIQRLEFLFKTLDHNFEFGQETIDAVVEEITEALFPKPVVEESKKDNE